MDDVESEIARFRDARAAVTARIDEIREQTAARLGPVEARIFEAQLLMLEDGEVVDRTNSYIRENHFTAPRAFELCMLEIEANWSRSGHPMVVDRLTDLMDVKQRVPRQLLGQPDPDFSLRTAVNGVILAKVDDPGRDQQATFQA